MSKQQQIEYAVFQYIEEPGWKITVERPVNLTEAERARRMKQIEKAAADLVISTEARRKAREANICQ